MSAAVRLLSLGAIAISMLTAQKRPAPVAPPAKNSAPGSTPSQAVDNSTNPWPDAQLPVMLSGIVVVEGGGDLPSNIAIQRFCGDLPHTVAWTDAKGRFSFQWNNYSGVTLEASDAEPNSLTRPDSNRAAGNAAPAQQLPGLNMLNCQLQADAPGFRSDRIDLTDHRALDGSDIGAILLHRVTRAKGASISATDLTAPRSARRAWQRGTELAQSDQQSDQAEAMREFEKAVRIDPRFSTAWVSLGHARERRQEEDLACEAFRKAIAADNRQAEAFIALGLVASRRGLWQEAAQYLDRALLLNPVDFPHLWYDDALADYRIGNLDRAEKNVREAVKQNSPNRERRAPWLLGVILMDKHDYPGADAAMRAYLREAPDVDDLIETMAKIGEIRGHMETRQ